MIDSIERRHEEREKNNSREKSFKGKKKGFRGGRCVRKRKLKEEMDIRM